MGEKAADIFTEAVIHEGNRLCYVHLVQNSSQLLGLEEVFHVWNSP